MTQKETELDNLAVNSMKVKSMTLARDITSYDLRKPWDTAVGSDQHPHMAWLPTEEGTLEIKEIDGFPVAVINEAHVYDLYLHYVREVSKSEKFSDMPEDLAILGIDIEDVHTAKHFNRTWVLEFDQRIFDIPNEERQLFLEGFTKTLLEGNPVQKHQTNFTALRGMTGQVIVANFSVFHT